MQVRRARAPGAAAMAVLLLACTLLAGWHEATVRHARCVDHGELVEVGAAGARVVGDQQIAAHDGTSTEPHDHCALCPRTHDGTPPALTHVAVPMRSVAPVAPRALRPRIVIAHGIVRLAPKTSPPDRSASVS
jgi:hypothetical protein